MRIQRYARPANLLALGLILALSLAAPSPSHAQSLAERHCVECGGVVKTGFPSYQDDKHLGGSQQFCEFTSKPDDFGSQSHIYAAVDTLYTELPTLAAWSYLFKPKYHPEGRVGTPSWAYCRDNLAGAPGSWVVDGRSVGMCVFPDLSMIDSWGLLYHTNGIIRGADLTSCLRYKPKAGAKPLFFTDTDETTTAEITLGGGAQFWAYISPSNDTAKWVTKWKVELQQGSWRGVITSDDPQQRLQTPGLSGTFNVKVTASGPGFGEKTLTPVSWSPINIGCNSNCTSMVGIVVTPDGKNANYWTTWDAICSTK